MQMSYKWRKESLQKKALRFILMNIERYGFELVDYFEPQYITGCFSSSPGCVPDSLGRAAFRSASRLFLWTAAFVLTKQFATQQLILSSDSYFESFWNIFSQSFPLKCPINKYEIITVFVEDSRLFLFVQSCWQSETPWDVHPSCMSNVADMMGCWRVVNILHRENQEEVNITSITNPHLELCFCNNICAIRPNPTFCLSWNEVSVKMIMCLSPGFLWQPLFAS